jgi:predicted component of type VI protein secretion system
VNVGALRHALQEMVTRFEPRLRLVLVQRERQPEVQVQLVGKLDVRDVSPLLAVVRGLGRAALLR